MNISVNYSGSLYPDQMYSAIDLDEYGGEPTDPVGYGPTEQAAIEDLLAQINGE